MICLTKIYNKTGTGPAVHDPSLQFPIPARMRLPGAEAADRSFLLSLLVKAHAPAELLLEKNGTVSPGAGGKRPCTQKNHAGSAGD